MNNRRKFRYIKIKEEEPEKVKPAKTSAAKKRKARRNSRVMRNIGNALTVVGTTISAMLLVLVIMICIVVVVVVRYVLQFADGGGGNLAIRSGETNYTTKFTTMVYGYDEEGQEIEVAQLADEYYCFWVDYEDISPNLIRAVIATEDKRFYEHKGVDWRRTVFSFAADLLNLSRAGEGGSTITQQLIKNLTGDDERSWERKLREIFSALNLEKKYTKTDIIESYLNNIGWGGMYYGVGAASERYFAKEAKDLTIAESAILASMIKNPSKRSPYVDLANCRQHQEDTLFYMYEQGYINTQEYEAALSEKVQFAYPVEGDDFGYTDPRSKPQNTTTVDNTATDSENGEDGEDGEDAENGEGEGDEVYDDETAYVPYRWNEYAISQDWYVDAAIRQVFEDYAELKGISYSSARKEISGGGYKIYINRDMALQKLLEEKYSDPYLAMYSYNDPGDSEKLLQSACVIMDYYGTILAVAGGLGDKPGDNCWNRATMSVRAPGSTMKPISAYSMGIQENLITYSTMMPDKSIVLPGTNTEWPRNFEGWPTGKLMPAWEAVRYSTNTVAVRVARLVTLPVLFNQLRSNLGVSTLVDEKDEQLSPIPLGALTDGIKLYELAGAYQMFGNGGVYYPPKMYSKVIDHKNNVVLEQDLYGNQAIDSDAAWVTNRMLRTVVTTPSGSGRYASLDPSVEVIGKTGTSNDDKNLLFVGLTPKYVTAVWLGVDDGTEIPKSGANNKYCAQIWHEIMTDVADTSEVQKFVADADVVEKRYCTDTGLLASSKCENTSTGYYRPTNIPRTCTGEHEEEIKRIWDKWDAVDENGGTYPRDIDDNAA